MGLGIIALVRKHRADPGHDRKGGQEQALEDERVVDVGRGHSAGHRHAIPVGCDMVLGAPLGPVRRIRAGEVAPALGAHGTGVEDQVGVAAQHADQHGVDAGQQARLGPTRQAPAQGRATGLGGRGGQAAPRRALAQEPAQRRHHPDSLGRRVARAAAWRPITSVDHCSDEVQKSEIQCGYPCLVSKLGQPQHRIKD